MSVLHLSLPLCIYGVLSNVFSLLEFFSIYVMRLNYVGATIGQVSLSRTANCDEISIIKAWTQVHKSNKSDNKNYVDVVSTV